MELVVSCLSSLTVALNDINSIKELESAVFPRFKSLFFSHHLIVLELDLKKRRDAVPVSDRFRV